MPQLGETVTEGTITKWLKAIGERVERDEPLFEVSTDKVDSEVPSPVTGVLTQILVKEGDTVDVGARLAVIGDGASAVADGADAAATAAPAPPEPPPAAAPPAPRSPAPPIAPAAPPVAAPPPGPVAPRVAAGASEVLSPMVRRLIDDHGLDATSLTGTGIGGRITREDVEAAIAGASSATAPTAPAPPVAVPAAPAPTAPAAAPAPMPAPIPVRAGADRDEVVPFTNIRRRTAEHMVRSKATSPHTLMVKEIDYERVEQVRRAHGERFRAEEGFGLSYLPFAARATVEALGDFPHLNASVGDDALVVHRDINLGIAVDLDNEGLIVPVVHRAEELTLRGMARRIRELADRARSRRLSADDISGGTFSITNAGPFGTLLTGAIINQPQVAILSTDGISRKPVVVALPDGTESIAIHSVGLAAVNFDHRAVDGAYVARFLSRVAEILDQRDWAGEL